MRNIVLILHTIISIIYFLLAITVIARSAYALIKKIDFKIYDKFIAFAHLISLYVQLFAGIVLYFFSQKQSNIQIDKVIEQTDSRFWSVEHFLLMIFAIAIAQLGYINTIHIEKSDIKFKKSLKYYSLSLMLILYSLFS